MKPPIDKVDEMGLTGPELAAFSRENLGGPAAAPYDFRAAFPKDHFVTQVTAYVSARTDAALEYAEAGALLLLAAATPGVKARLAPYPDGLGTNLYVLGIGDSTRSRKSTSSGFIRRVQKAALPESLLSDQFSPEAFVEQLAARSPDSTTWYVDEFGDMLHKISTAKYMAGLRGLLLSAYDGRDHRAARHSKRNKGGDAIEDTDTITEPNLSILGMTTPMLFPALRPADVESGLLARFAIVYPSSKPPRRPLQALPHEGAMADGPLIAWLHAVSVWARKHPRPVRFEAEALQIIDHFALALEEAEADDVLKAMSSRLTHMIVKVGMLSAAGRAETLEGADLRVTAADAAAAQLVVERWQGYARAFASRVGETDFERAVLRCLQMVQGRADLPRRVIARSTHLEKRMLDRVEETLEDRGLIRVVKTGTTAKGLAATSWEWTG